MPEKPIPIERDGHVLRARRTAATTRVLLGLVGVALILAEPSLLPHPALGVAGFATILVTSIVQLAAPRLSWLRIEETIATAAAILIVGFGDQHVSAVDLLWLVAVATGVMARGGRVHWLGRTVVAVALLLPIIREGHLSAEYAAFCFAVVGLQYTSGRLTLELNRLLRQARLDAESAETLLLAGDIAARVAQENDLVPSGRRPALPGPPQPMSAEEESKARHALARLLEGEGLEIAVQPIVDVRDGRIHAHEALARFGRRRADRGPQQWFGLADELGERAALERVCLRAALELFVQRPRGTSLTINLSIPTLLDGRTHDLLATLAADLPDQLEGLVLELTEETLVSNDLAVDAAIDSLRKRGMRLAVDDIGAGYSGLRQITAVQPDYMKLDRSLVTDIDRDDDRAALVSALCGYASKVGGLIVAEGVEDRAELTRLQELGVPLAQGFFLAPPGRPWPGLTPEAVATLPTRLAALGERPEPILQPT